MTVDEAIQELGDRITQLGEHVGAVVDRLDRALELLAARIRELERAE